MKILKLTVIKLQVECAKARKYPKSDPTRNVRVWSQISCNKANFLRNQQLKMELMLNLLFQHFSKFAWSLQSLTPASHWFLPTFLSPFLLWLISKIIFFPFFFILIFAFFYRGTSGTGQILTGSSRRCECPNWDWWHRLVICLWER